MNKDIKDIELGDESRPDRVVTDRFVSSLRLELLCTGWKNTCRSFMACLVVVVVVGVGAIMAALGVLGGVCIAREDYALCKGEPGGAFLFVFLGLIIFLSFMACVVRVITSKVRGYLNLSTTE